MGLGLNLADADLSGGFDAIPSGWYHCSVFDVKMIAVKEDGKLPKGTPGLNVQFKIEQEEAANGDKVHNRRLFRNLYIAPAKIGNKPYEHKKMMDRILGQFFVCLGFTEEEVKSGNFDPDPQDLIGKELLVNAGQKQKYGAPEGVMDNEVKGFRPMGEVMASGRAKLL